MVIMRGANTMDISSIDATKVTTENGLFIGSSTAPIKIIEFMNVRCPFCKKWFDESLDTLNEYVSQGRVQRIIKLFDKEKESLQRGNVMHHYIDYKTPDKAVLTLKAIYNTQEKWGNLTLDEVASFAENQLNLTLQKQPEMIQSIINEANEAHIKFVPTIIIDQHIFDESITKTELINYLEGN